MIKKIITRAVLMTSALFALGVSTVFAQGGGQTQNAPFYPTVQPTNLPATADFGILLTKVINYFLGLVGLIAVLMLVIGGLRYITSAGNEGTLEKAKHTILYAIIGIVVVVLAYAIVFTITNTLITL